MDMSDLNTTTTENVITTIEDATTTTENATVEAATDLLPINPSDTSSNDTFEFTLSNWTVSPEFPSNSTLALFNSSAMFNLSSAGNISYMDTLNTSSPLPISSSLQSTYETSSVAPIYTGGLDDDTIAMDSHSSDKTLGKHSGIIIGISAAVAGLICSILALVLLFRSRAKNARAQRAVDRISGMDFSDFNRHDENEDIYNPEIKESYSPMAMKEDNKLRVENNDLYRNSGLHRHSAMSVYSNGDSEEYHHYNQDGMTMAL